jgi:hypothetical protein
MNSFPCGSYLVTPTEICLGLRKQLGIKKKTQDKRLKWECFLCMYYTVLTLPSKTLTGISYGDDSTFVSFYTRDIDSLFHEEGNQVHKLICYYPGKERKLIHYHIRIKWQEK